MEYMKHRYSKRVYQVRRDHGENHPYLSCFPFVRYVTSSTMERFFTKCSEPRGEVPLVTVQQEIDWEKKQLRKEEPLMVKAPTPTKRSQKKNPPRTPGASETGEYTLKDLCLELGTTPAVARKLLRAKGKAAPTGGWRWTTKEAAKPIKKFLKKLL